MRVEDVARVCHEVNRAYCQALEDDTQPSWEHAPAWQTESLIQGVTLHLSGDISPRESHENWLAEKERAGWRWGEIKDEQAKTHPCMVSFSELPVEQKAKDFLFRAVVHSLRPHIEAEARIS